ncbi:hypothetical protein O3M35_005847 [Rhynocoris fuscipes]|uniref:Alpha N-terminal protein methyltransferase 1 n=1 Tax=Rhynocoris fuscipes TaxID=488301 RepID=A0AAW1DQJ0_9HEMI
MSSVVSEDVNVISSNAETSEEDKESDDSNEEHFYENAKHYWAKIPATVDGMLGGYGFISQCDLESSARFLQSLLEAKDGPGGMRALDCGAGIGRITKHLLMKYFKVVDLVEQNKDFIEKVNEFIGPSKKLGKLYCTGLQSFVPEEKYDVIWCQWVLGHLTDEDLIKFLKLCQCALSVNGLIVIKENVTSSGEREKDHVDSSITRPFHALLDIFKSSDLRIIKMEQQTKFPKGLYPVKMFALKPNSQ